jgi:hypothetical protein
MRGWPNDQAGYDLYNLANPLREHILEVLHSSSNGPLGLISRNRYGCRVLNTHRVAFVDIDEEVPQLKRISLFERLRWLFVSSPPPDPKPTVAVDTIPAQLLDFSRRNPNWGLRVYRTAAGWRVLVTHSLFEPESSPFQQAMQQMGADELYIRLCRGQKLFRARLSPKPWRVGCPSAEAQWPVPDTTEEKRMEKWVVAYDQACRGKGVCHFLTHLGAEDSQDPAIAEVIKIHDGHCLATEAPLA